MPDVVPAFLRREEHERSGDERQYLIKRSWSRGPKERLQFGEGLFDGVEVGTAGRQKSVCAPTASMAVRTSGCIDPQGGDHRLGSQ
jgi:hypothetical protein